jgi:hypothetical protein
MQTRSAKLPLMVALEMYTRPRSFIAARTDRLNASRFAVDVWATTVRNYIANVLSALGVHTRLQAVVVGRADAERRAADL